MNEVGRIIEEEWNELPVRYPNVDTDAFTVMPNHIHGIIWIRDDVVEAPLASVQESGRGDPCGRPWAGTRPAPTIGDIVGGFKSLTSVEYIRFQKSNNQKYVHFKLWQRNYWERVIRNERELDAVRHYIKDNPLKGESYPEKSVPYG